MSTLTELKPAGGSGKTVDFVASGALPNGAKVILKSDGKVEVAGESTTTYTESIPAGAEYSPAQELTFHNSVVYTSTAGIFIWAYLDSPTSTGRIIVGTVSGTVITFGTEYVFESTSKPKDISLTIDPNTPDSFVVAYRHYSSASSYGHLKVVAGTIAGTALTFGTGVVVSSAPVTFVSTDFDPYNSGKFVVCYYQAGSADEGLAIVGTVSGTSLSFGSSYVFESAKSQYISMSYDPNTSGKFIIAYRANGGLEYGYLRVGTISGTSLTFGTRYNFNAAGTFNMSVAFVTNTAGKFILAYKDASNSYYCSSKLGTISGTNVSTGSKVTARSYNPYSVWVSFDPADATRFVVTTTGVGVYAVVGTLSGSTITYGSEHTMATTGNEHSASFDPNSPGKFVTVFKSAPDGEAVISQLSASETTTNLTATNFLGTSTEAYADTATATILMQGGISTNQTGLTIGSDYYVQADGTLSTSAGTPSVKLGKALSTTTALLSGE